MKKLIIIAVSLLLLTSCVTYTGIQQGCGARAKDRKFNK